MITLQVIAYIRLCRPGSILGPQQIYLHEQQARMWTAGNQQPQSASLGAVPRNVRATAPAAVSAPARSRSLSSSQTRGAVSQPSAQRVAAVPYTTKPSSSVGAASSSSAGVSHPALAGFANADAAPSTSAARLRRLESMPAQVSSTRSPSVVQMRKSDSASLVGTLSHHCHCKNHLAPDTECDCVRTESSGYGKHLCRRNNIRR